MLSPQHIPCQLSSSPRRTQQGGCLELPPGSQGANSPSHLAWLVLTRCPDSPCSAQELSDYLHMLLLFYLPPNSYKMIQYFLPQATFYDNLLHTHTLPPVCVPEDEGCATWQTESCIWVFHTRLPVLPPGGRGDPLHWDDPFPLNHSPVSSQALHKSTVIKGGLPPNLGGVLCAGCAMGPVCWPQCWVQAVTERGCGSSVCCWGKGNWNQMLA